MSNEKIPMIRFLHDEVRRAQDKVDKARKREEAEKQALLLRERLAYIIPSLDEDQKGTVAAAIQFIAERDDLLKWKDYHDEAYYWLRRAGYWHPTAVEDRLTVLDMAENLANHRSDIQGFLECALQHFGVSEEEMTDLRSGRNMERFYKAHPDPSVAEFEHLREVVLKPHMVDTPKRYGFAMEYLKEDERHAYKHAPNYADILYLKEYGKWPEDEMPEWVDERRHSRDWRNSALGDNEFELVALKYEYTQALKQIKQLEKGPKIPTEGEVERADRAELAPKALQDMRTAMIEVQRKLTTALNIREGTEWADIVQGIGVLCRDVEHWKEAHRSSSQEQEKTVRTAQKEILKAHEERDSALSEREATLMALKVVRDIIIEADRLACEAVGNKPTPDAEYASDLVDSVERVIGCMEENSLHHKTVKEEWVAEKTELKSEISQLRKGDETAAGRWKRHYWTLAASLETPRSLMGMPEQPDVDQIMKYVSQVINPVRTLTERMNKVEKRFPAMAEKGREMAKGTESPEECEPAQPPWRKPSGVWVCCGRQLPAEAQFCPTCSGDAPGMILKPQLPLKDVVMVSCECGTSYEVGKDVKPEDTPALCPCCGGTGQAPWRMQNQIKTEEEAVFADPAFTLKNKRD